MIIFLSLSQTFPPFTLLASSNCLLYSQKFYSITIIYLILTLQILFRYWLNDTTFSSSTINEKKFYTDFELKLFWPISVKAAISIYYFIQGDYWDVFSR